MYDFVVHRELGEVKVGIFASELGRKSKRIVENAENGCTSTQPHKNLINFKNSRCGWETHFTRPHGGRLMILPVDSSA